MNAKKLLSVSLVFLFVLVVLTTESWAVPTIELCPSSWSLYVDSVEKELTLGNAWIYAVNGIGAGPLYDRGEVIYPSMTVAGNSTDGWTLSGGTIKIIDWEFPTTEYMVGTLGIGDLIPDGNNATAYTSFQTDIAVTDVDNSISSPVLDDIAAVGKLDFHLNLVGIGPTGQLDFENALQSEIGEYYWKAKKSKSPSLNSSMTIIPAPGALVLSSIGLVFISVGANFTSWLRKRKAP